MVCPLGSCRLDTLFTEHAGILLSAFYFSPYSYSQFLFLLIVLAPLISLSVYYILPSVEAYAGLSGVLHGLYVAGAVIYSQYKESVNLHY